jgi:hypothetical protein
VVILNIDSALIEENSGPIRYFALNARIHLLHPQLGTRMSDATHFRFGSLCLIISFQGIKLFFAIALFALTHFLLKLKKTVLTFTPDSVSVSQPQFGSPREAGDGPLSPPPPFTDEKVVSLPSAIQSSSVCQ